MIKQRSPYNPHPGEFIQDELQALNWSQADLARALGVPRDRISEIIRGERSITADTALRLARWLNTSPEMWLRLQEMYDLQKTEQTHGAEIAAQVTPLEAMAHS
jgi:addiction module HigA family antidote